MKNWTVLSLIAVVVVASIYVSVRSVRYLWQQKQDGFRHFTLDEFDSPDAPGSGAQHMSKSFIHQLDDVRDDVGFPLFVTSGYRTVDYNTKVGGIPGSAHTRGLAVDITAPTEGMKRSIATAAISEGITRIGWGRTFIHLDVDQTKPQKITWGYADSPAPNYNSLV
jgi:zinc D-Ala-D-Ala carboxypeptidase